MDGILDQKAKTKPLGKNEEDMNEYGHYLIFF